MTPYATQYWHMLVRMLRLHAVCCLVVAKLAEQEGDDARGEQARVETLGDEDDVTGEKEATQLRRTCMHMCMCMCMCMWWRASSVTLRGRGGKAVKGILKQHKRAL